MFTRIVLVLMPLVMLFTACTTVQPGATPAPRTESAPTVAPATLQPTTAPAASQPTAEPHPATLQGGGRENTPAPGAGATSTTQSAAKGEIRAFWVDAFHEGFKTPEQVDRLLKDVQTSHANAVIVQVRRRGDSYFLKSLEPRTQDPELAPGFDALQNLIDKAHKQSPKVEVHAWLATLPVLKGSVDQPSVDNPNPQPRYTAPTDPKHVFNTHGPKATGTANWIAKNHRGEQFDGSNFALDPGNPAAEDYTIDIYLDVLRKYDVDGLHMDYVRYAEKLWGYNDVSVARFNQRHGRTGTPSTSDPLWAQWRRDQITALVRKLYLKAIAIKPQVKISAATIAWANGPAQEEDWSRSSPYIRTFQDWRAWLEEGILDVAMPMAYFRESEPLHRDWYDQWIEWSKNHRYSRQVSIGIGVWNNTLAENYIQIREALAPSKTGQRADGVTFYSYAVTNFKVPDANELAERGIKLTPEQLQQSRADNTAFFRGLTANGPKGEAPLFADSVPTPEMTWKTKPTTGHLMGTALGADRKALDGATVTLTGSVNRKQTSDGTGFFGFVDLPPGSYTVTVKQGDRTISTGEATVEVGKVAEVGLS